MGYVDLQRRRERAGIEPFLSIAAALGVVVSWVALTFLFQDGMLAAAVMLASILMIALAKESRQPGEQRRESVGHRPGVEKQLLLAIRDAGGITPVEAALETSLTVDEAEEVLTRLADRGHLLVESRDGALFYLLPGRHGLEDRDAPGP